MSVRLLGDENTSHKLVRACERLLPDFPLVHIATHKPGWLGYNDDDLLDACLENSLILVAHDRRTLGVAMHPANNGDTVPVAYSGVVTVHCGTNAVLPDAPLKADPTQAGCVVTATLTDAGVIGVAQQASSNGTVQAILQSL